MTNGSPPLQDGEARFRAIFDAAVIGIALVDLEGHPVESNRALQRLLGYSGEELRGLTFPSLTHPEDVEADVALARELFAGQREAYQIEKRYVRKDGGIVWGRLTASLVRDAAGVPRYGLGMVEEITEWVRLRTRREAVLRLARRFAEEGHPDQLLQNLLTEAVELTGGNTGLVARLDEAKDVLQPVWSTLPAQIGPVSLQRGQGAGGQAAARREPVIINDYQHALEAFELARQAGLHAVLSVPLLHEGRLLGVVTVASDKSGDRFTPEDAVLLEILAGLASSVLVSAERMRLEGALLAARTAEHVLNNQLSAVMGYADLLAEDPTLPETLRELAQEIRSGAEEAARAVAQLRRITRLEEARDQGGPGPVLDLARSTEPPPAR